MNSEYTPNRYKLTEKIGEGVHGIVLRAIDLITGQDVAIKKISLRNKYGEIALTAIREIKTLQNCDHKNVSRNFKGSVFKYMRINVTCSFLLKDPFFALNICRSIRCSASVRLYAVHFVHENAKQSESNEPYNGAPVHGSTLARTHVHA